MTERLWRGGMIGAGAWSEVQLEAWTGVTNARIVGLTDRHPERRDPVIKKFNIPLAFNDFEAMLDEVELDFVDICTRPYSHAALIKVAADRGLPILCQKPFCTSLSEAQEVIDYCDRVGVRLMINENFRWQAWFRKAKEILALGEMGKPFFAKFRRRRRLTVPRFGHKQAYFAEMPRLIVYEVGVHLLDVFRYLFGEPDSVFARLHQISPQIKGEDVQIITLNYADMTCFIYDSWASVPLPVIDKPTEGGQSALRILEIDGMKGTLIIKPDGSLHLFGDSDHQHWQFPANTIAESHTAAQQHFIDCLESGVEFETSGSETIKTMALVYACYRSAEEGEVVDLKEFLQD